MGFEVGVWCAFSPVSTALTSTLKEEFSGMCATVKVSVFLSALTVGLEIPVTDCEKPLATSCPAPGVSAEAIDVSSKVAPWGALTVIVAFVQFARGCGVEAHATRCASSIGVLA